MVQTYGALKLKLAAQYERDRERYLQEKAPFIEEVLRLASLAALSEKGDAKHGASLSPT